MSHQNNKFVRISGAKDWTGLSRSTLYAMMKNGEFPQSISLTQGRAVGWLVSDIQAWIDSRIALSKTA